jgi:hypothetical protein
MYRAIEVFLPKDEDNLPMGKLCFVLKLLTILVLILILISLAEVNGSVDIPRTDCWSPSIFYGVILGLGIVLLI